MKVELTEFETEFIRNQIKIEIERIKENLFKISDDFHFIFHADGNKKKRFRV